MAIAIVAHYSEGSTTNSGFTTASVDTTGANFIILGLATDGNSGAISDSKSNTWTPLTQVVGQFNDRWLQLFYAENPTVGSGHTFSVTGSTNYPSITIAAFSGVATSLSFDVENGQGGYGTNIQPGSITPSVDNELVVVIGTSDDGTTPTVDSGFTIAENYAGSPGLAANQILAYIIETTATAKNPTITYGAGSQRLEAAIASFKASGGAAQTPLDLNPQYKNPHLPIPQSYTWLQSHTYLVGRDTLNPGHQQTSNPTLPLNRNFGWEDVFNLSLVGKDTLPFRNRYPEPITPIRIQDWQQGFSLNLATVIVFPPGKSYVLNPTLPVNRNPDWEDYFFLGLQGQDVLPKNQYSWPVPKGPYFPDQTFYQYVKPQNIIFFPAVIQSWVVPKGADSKVSDWQHYVIPVGQDTLPFRTNTSNPVLPILPNKDYINFFDLNLIGKDSLPVGQRVVAVPKGPDLPTLLWTFSPNVPPVVQFVGPFNQKSWTNPFIPLRSSQDWTNFLTNIPPPIPPVVQVFGGRVVTIEEYEEQIHARPYREGIRRLEITQAAQALGRKGGIASGKARR